MQGQDLVLKFQGSCKTVDLYIISYSLLVRLQLVFLNLPIIIITQKTPYLNAYTIKLLIAS